MPSKDPAPAPVAAAPASPAADRKKAPTKPDQEAFEKELAEINANIEVLKVKLSESQSKINGISNINETFSGPRKELRDQLDVLNKKRNELQDQRSKLLEQIKTIQASLKKKSDEVRNSKASLGYKTVEEIDAQVR
ncbi:hypothetical protein BDK51DRAFT_45839 [Blyttiomyces helicus]|uniref:Uncharacterized protein n=1 Tax=Blyttiomyces helicus TaxID=388810 RepID=A0A4P9WFA0_9FUNG|nr:hypothetical protein BDK51DRAFT_45839 [Blyttiomyces helicus]|eukprot:RKO91304.1 hypothetical protein BDK51DRAFT_45839 [Blyttiomyces helicus]